MEFWVALVAYDIVSPPSPPKDGDDPHAALRRQQDENRDAILKWCTGDAHSRYSESAYAVQLNTGTHPDAQAVVNEIVRSLKHKLQPADRIVAQELVGHPEGGDDAAKELSFRSVRAPLPVGFVDPE